MEAMRIIPIIAEQRITMKTFLIATLACTCLSFAAISQFEFYIQGDQSGTNYAGGTYTYQAVNISDENPVYIDVVNKTGSSETYVVGRKKLSPVASSWEDGFCWEGSNGVGICIPPSSMMQDEFQMQNNDVPILPDQAGELKAQFFPETSDVGSFTYRYYIGTLNDNKMDSMDIEVFITPLSVPEPTLIVGIQPNPANENITINAEGFSSADVQIVDVLGNVVLNTELAGSKTIDVAEFRNGIYFVTVSAAGTRVSRKVIVRH
ncbi:MAG: hypothetical protein Crog4KO_17360 [Crocinitomicaceae bacterium]